MADSSIRSGQDPPTGTVTFLFTDIEGSTKLWERYPDAMKAALARHDALLRGAMESNGGYVFKTVGDAFCAAFSTAPDALSAALEAQRALSAEPWGKIGPLKVRMALHTGATEERGGDYFGQPLNRVARLLSAGHGGQILLSLATQELARDHLPEGVSLRDLGDHRLKDLARPEHVFQVVSPDLPIDFPPLKTLDARPNNLPAQPTPLIGREKEAEAVRKLLLRDDVRLVTLTGPGGTGKTRLGLQVAADLIDDFESGVFFVALAPISDPSLVASNIAHTVGVRETTTGRPLLDGLKDYLRDRGMLLVLDNFEQVVSSAPLVADLLATCPRLKVLATSREVLHLRGEHDFLVSPLALPDPKRRMSVETLTQYDAVSLFIQRAIDVKPDFAVTNENAPAVAEICHRLDGLPLAIELAAARTKLLTPQSILSRLSSRMRLLTGGARDLPARQQTIRNAIAWSYDLLVEEEKRLFRRLSVFVGGFTLPAAETVCNAEGNLQIDVLDGVSSLVDKSLLKQEEIKGEPRFVMLETIREYGLGQLAESGEERDIRRRHFNFYLTLAEEAEAELWGPDQVSWLDRLEAEHDNLRAALGWSIGSKDAGSGLRLAGALWGFWFARGYFSEGREWLEEALSGGGSAPASARAKALYGAGLLAAFQGDYSRAVALGGESMALCQELGDRRGGAISHFILGLVAYYQGNYGRATELLEKSLALFREVGDRWGIAHSLRLLGQVALDQEDQSRAKGLLAEGLALFREIGDRWGIALSLRNLGIAAHAQGDYAQATALYDESLALWREVGDKWGVALSLHRLGLAIHARGDYGWARELFEESLSMFREVGDKGGGTAWCLEGLAGVAIAQEQPKHAAQLLGAAEALRQAIGVPLRPSDRPDYDRTVSAVSDALDEKVFEATWDEGRKMTPEEAIGAYRRVREQAAQAPPQPATSASAHPAGLTARQIEVLRLVAMGLTNAQIAGKLGLSTRTVNAHLHSICKKIGVTSRTAAARYAVDNGIV